MVKRRSASQDLVFRSLADASRRRILERLAHGEATLSELAGPLEISLPAVHKHLALLESASLVSCERRGRERICRLEPAGFERASAWIDGRRRLWQSRLTALDAYLNRIGERDE